jgi:hypothetical protein
MSNCGSTPVSLSIWRAGAKRHGAAAAGDADSNTPTASTLAAAVKQRALRSVIEVVHSWKTARQAE